MESEALCRVEAARRRAAFLGLDGDVLRLEVREPAIHLAKALRARDFEAEAVGDFTVQIRSTDWSTFWSEAGPLIDCGC
ncbi:MAG TPA: hypothetical protein VJ623_04505 [Holophagaceae bacterium]|nr:hypothetical protein [Holophagaceae bacterium]